MSTSVSASHTSGTSSTSIPASTHPSSPAALSTGAILGIVLGTIAALAILVGLVITLVRRRRLRRSGFERVDNPRLLHDVKGFPKIRSRGVVAPPGRERYMQHSQQSSVEPLLLTTADYSPSGTRSPRSPFRPAHSDGVFVADYVELGVIQAEYDPYAVVNDSTGGSTVSNAPPVANWEYSPQSKFGNQTHWEMEETNKIAPGTVSHWPRTPPFINRTLKKHPDRVSSTVVAGHGEQTGLLTEKDAPDPIKQLTCSLPETHNNTSGSRTEGEPPSASIPAQQFTEETERPLVPPKGPTPLQPAVRSTRKLTRRAHSPGFSGALAPVAETPDLSQVPNFNTPHPPLPITNSESHHDSAHERSSSLSVTMSHDIGSTSPSALVDESPPMPLLASTSFGRGNLTPTPTPSNSSNIGSNPSSRSSRYPSLAPSSLGQCSGSRPHSDGHTDWHHPPSGLAGLKDLQIEPLQNPYSPVKTAAPQLPPPSPPLPSCSGTLTRGETRKRAYLRENTSSSVTEVQRREVSQGGIATIDVTL